MDLDSKRKELEKIILNIPEFVKSSRANWQYNAVLLNDDVFKTLVIKMDKTNFKVILRKKDYEFKVISEPLKNLDIEKTFKYIKRKLGSIPQ